MTRRLPVVSAPRPELRIKEAPDAVRLKLADRIAKGEEFRRLSDPAEFKRMQQEWTDYNEMLLRKLFTTDEVRDEYVHRTPTPTMYFGVPTAPQLMRREVELLDARIAILKSVVGRLDLIPTLPDFGGATTVRAATASNDITKAFIVHGQDLGARDAVARVLVDLGIEPIILFEQPSGGMTVIEKLEHYSNVGFAVVLLTPDDEGRQIGSAAPQARARQNVVLELGYFIGKVGRLRVCPLYKGELELPSDYHGVVYVGMDDAGAWKYKLAGELKLAGYEIDKNRIS
jgi:hypothetical protein